MTNESMQPSDGQGTAEHRPDASPDQTRERKLPTVVAHCFVFKTADREFIKNNIDKATGLGDLTFTHTILRVEQDGEYNESFFPLGTVNVPVQKNALRRRRGDLEKRIGAELFESGYIRGAEYRLLGRRITNSQSQPINEIFTYTEASPFDQLYQMAGEGENEQRVYRFVDLGKIESHASSSAGAHGRKSGALVVIDPQDPLRISPIPDRVHAVLMRVWQETEMKKKQDIIRALFYLSDKKRKLPEQEQQQLQQAITDIKSPSQAQQLYRDYVNTYAVTQEQLLDALTLANLIEELRQLDAHCDPIEATLRFIGILPKLNTLPASAFSILQEESKHIGPYLTTLFSRVIDMYDYDKQGTSIATESMLGSMPKLIGLINSRDPFHITRAGEILEKIFGIPQNEYFELSKAYDDHIALLSADIIGRHLGKEVNVALFEQLNDLVHCNPADLLQTACRTGKLVEKYEKETKINGDKNNLHLVDRLVFEAQWKLFAMTLLHEVFAYRQKKMEQGHDELRDVWREFVSVPDVLINKYTVYSVDGKTMIDICTDQEADALVMEKYRALEKDGEVIISSAERDLLRRLTLENGKTVLVRVPERATKDLHSLFRKKLHGSHEPKDFFAREIVIVSDDNSLLERVSHTIDVLEDDTSSAGSLAKKKRRFNEQAVVFEIINTYKKRVSKTLGKDWTCDVYEFKPTPEGELMPFMGKRPGSGGEIRMSKFYLILKNTTTGFEDAEEIQLFVPDFRKSGFAYHEDKKKDDVDYRVRRYLYRNGIRSIGELRFPHSIYPDMPTVYLRMKSSHGGLA